MKWSIAGLMLLGVGAAVCASVMVASLRVGTPAVASSHVDLEDVQIMVAAGALPAMSVVDARSVMIKNVPANETPDNFMRRPTDVIGKLLAVPMVEGQVFTTGHFVDDKSGARLASALAHGMRAVSVSLSPEKAGMLYPGCVVDVLVSLNRPSPDGTSIREAISMTLLQGIEVLAIDEASVMSEASVPEPTETETTGATRRGRRDRLVTLMVNSNQAKALQLAAQYGSVSLALRNPLDASPVETESTMLSDLADEYSRIVAVLAPPQAEGKEGTAGEGAQAAGGPTDAASVEARARLQRPAPPPAPVEPVVIEKPERPKWETVVNRGGQIELIRFRRPEGVEPEDAQSPLSWIFEGSARSAGDPK